MGALAEIQQLHRLRVDNLLTRERMTREICVGSDPGRQFELVEKVKSELGFKARFAK
jgi:hypothetical protein